MSTLTLQKTIPAIFKNARLVDMPYIEIGKDFISDLYKALGWNGKEVLIPNKVIFNPIQYDELLCQYIANGNNGMDWLLNGPNSDARVPYGKILLLEGWCE